MSLLPPVFIDSVVALGNKLDDGTTDWKASGFLFGSLEAVPNEGWDENGPKYTLWLVTNRHVVNILRKTVIRFDSSTKGNAIEILLEDLLVNDKWTHHPETSIDVSVIQLKVDYLNLHINKIHFFEEEKTSATLNKLETLGVHEGNGGFILGFPLGMVEGPKGSVIVRKSTIARIRNAYEQKTKTILVDGTVFPGNSGGPAVIHPEPIVITGTLPIQNAFLIGVVSEYVTYKDTAVSPQTGRPRVVFEENTGLTIVYTVDCINEAITFAKAAKV